MLGVILLKAFYSASQEELEASGTSQVECRCIVDPRNRNANPHVNATHPGNVTEMPSVRLSYESLKATDSWKKNGLKEFHSQLRSALDDPDQMTRILQQAQASLDKGHLHTKEGRLLCTKVFARNMTEANVCSYNSWLHMNWFEMTTLGHAKPQHFQVTPGLNCPDMVWVFPRTPTQVTIRTSMTPQKAKRFVDELKKINVAFEVQ